MKVKRAISALMVIVMLITMAFSPLSISFASTIPYAGVDISTGHAFPVNVILGPDDKLYVAEYSGNKIMQMDKDGSNKVTYATGFSQPIGMVFDASGNLYVSEHNGSKVTKVDTSGNISLVNDIDGGYLTGIVLDSSNKIFVLDYTGGKIYKMDLDGSNFTTFATGFSTTSIIGLAIDSNDNLYVSDRSGGKILKVTPDGTVSNFVTGITTVQGVSLGKDGYFYTSSSSRNIEKIDQNGAKITTFSTGTVNPWGLATDHDGYIYFGESSSTVRLFAGYAETLDTKTIKLTMNQEIDGNQADPSAFTITGVATNPQATAVTTSGAIITITLDKPISPQDTAVKVSYSKTGTDNLLVAGTAYEFNRFSNLPVKNNTLKVLSVASIPQIDVINGTLLSSVGLPSTVSLNISDSTTTSVNVTWDNGTPAYNGDVAGTYVFSGTFDVSGNISNPNSVKASVSVVVGEVLTPHLVSIESLPDIHVPYGTAYDAISLPATATAHLSDSTTLNVPVVWDEVTPAYVSTSPAIYVITGTVNADAFLNLGNIKASVNVILGDAPIVVVTPPALEPDPTPVPQENTIVKVNGEALNIGIEEKSIENGVSRVDVSVVSETIEKMIDEVIEKNLSNPNASENTVEINVVDTTADLTVVGLTGEIVKKLEENDFDVIIKKGSMTYSIPAVEFTVDAVARRLSVAPDRMDSITFEFQTQLLDDATQMLISNQVTENNAESLFPATEFHLVAKVVRVDGTTEELPLYSFSQYVDRTFELPSGLSSSDITTGIVFNSDYTYTHVPTYVFTKDGKNYAQIHSLTNSTYTVIHNPVHVESVKGHWAQATVDNLASRLILTDTQNFQADANITRGELAEYLVRALGLYRNDHQISSKYMDVTPQSEHAIAISIASQWGIINGYNDGTFKPDADLTREEAMTMYARALAITPYASESKGLSATDISSASQWAKPFVITVLDSKVFVGRLNDSMDFKAHLTHAEALTAIENLLNVSNLTDKNN